MTIYHPIGEFNVNQESESFPHNLRAVGDTKISHRGFRVNTESFYPQKGAFPNHGVRPHEASNLTLSINYTANPHLY